jgi:hypothetical protein
MFAVHVSNPFTAKSRRLQNEQDILDKTRNDRDARDATRRAAWESNARQDDNNRKMAGMSGPGKKSTLADRAKFQFEADSDDDQMENEIDSNLDDLHGAATRLNQLSRAIGVEADTQIKHLDRVNEKTDKVDDHIAMNRAKLDKFK